MCIRDSYNAATCRYEKYQCGQPHIDAATGESLSFDNALLLYTSIQVIDQIGHVDVALDSGTGYYFTRGQYEPIRWKKGGVSDPLLSLIHISRAFKKGRNSSREQLLARWIKAGRKTPDAVPWGMP